MRRTSIPFALALATLAAADSAAASAAQEPERTLEASSMDEPPHPSVLLGVRHMAREHVRIGEVGLAEAAGNAGAIEELVDEAIAKLPERIRHLVDDDPLDAGTACELLLHGRAIAVFQTMLEDARRRGRPLSAADLLLVVWADRLRELPDERDEPELIAFVRRAEQLAGKSLPLRLWWPTVGYLLFAALHEPSFWPERAEERVAGRAALIHDLLAITTTSRDAEAVCQVVDVALAPPLLDQSSGTALTCARGPLATWRGRVGFTADHLRIVSEWIDQGPDSQKLSTFMAAMKLRILQELDPASVERPGGSKHGTAEESRAYYEDVLEQRGIQSFWIEARGDVEKMLAGRFAHPLDPKVRALEERLEGADLTDEDRVRLKTELATLIAARSRDHASVGSFIVFQLGYEAPPDQVVAEMKRLDRMATDYQQQTLLLCGWAALGLREDVAWAKRLVSDRFERDELTSQPAIGAAAMALRMHADDPDCARALLTIASDGRPQERESASSNSQDLPEELARGMFDIFRDDLEEVLRRNPDAKANHMREEDQMYSSLLRSAVSVLRGRSNEPWAREALLATFECEELNLWNGGSPFSGDIDPGNREVLEWVARTLPPRDYERLEAAGRIPSALQRVHDEILGPSRK